MRKLIFSPLFLLAVACHSLGAQVFLQVATRQIQKEFTFREGCDLNIEGQNAEVIITTWDREIIEVHMEISAKHPDKETALKELDRMQYLADREGDRIFLRNYLQASDRESQTRFEVKYRIHMPPGCPVYLKSSFGLVNIKDLTNRLRLNSEFTQIGLTDIQGMMDLRTRFGNIHASRIRGDVSIQSRRADLILEEIGGRFNIDAHYGTLKLFATDQLLDLNISAEKTDVFLYNATPAAFAYQLEGQQSEMSLPGELEFQVLEGEQQSKKVSFKPQKEYFANITIRIRFGDLMVEKASGIKP